MQEEKTVINGLAVNFKIGGEGKPLLILHGWGSRSDKWQRVGELLAKSQIKTIIPDLPGFGKSQKPSISWGLGDYCDFLENFVSQINLDNFYLLGHSFGGALAAKYSLKNSKKVKKLFLVGASCVREKTVKQKIFNILAKFLKIFSFLPFFNLFRKAFYKFIIKRSDYPYVEGVMKESYLKVIADNLSNDLSLIQLPTVIVWGKRDDVVPVKSAYLIKEKIKNSKLEIIENGDHDLEQKAPEILTDKILENL